MIVYSIVVLLSWVGSIFVPFFFTGFESNEGYEHQKDSHFLRG